MERQAMLPPKKTKQKKKKRLAFWLVLLLFFSAVFFISAIISYNYVMKNSNTEKEAIVIKPGEGVEFIVDRGANTTDISKKLKELGFIKNENIFKFLSKINGYDGTYQSGTHIISKSLSDDELMRILSDVPASRQVTIPEGKTFKQIVDILYEKQIIKDKDKFIRVANSEDFDYDFLQDLPPRDNKLEGYLFPDTYEFDMNAGEDVIIIKMLDNFDRKFKAEYREKLKSLKDMTLDKVVRLASLIEKEAQSADDRYLISGVLYNRLNSKDRTLRKLQIDATVQYVLLKTTGAYKERLLYTDLDIDDPYNTYKNEGLPPGPICCPGEAAIRAALNPATDEGYYYYVAKNDGTGDHEFSKTFKEHQAAVKKYSVK